MAAYSYIIMPDFDQCLGVFVDDLKVWKGQNLDFPLKG